MSVTDVIEVGQTGGEHKNERNFLTRHEFTREFIVLTTGGENAASVKKARGVPRIGDSLGYGTDAVCQDVRARQDAENPKVWHIEVDYLSIEAPSDNGTGGSISKEIETKMLQPPKIRSGFVHSEVCTNVDIYGDPVVNSAGDPFSPPPTRRAHTLWIEVSRLEPDSGVIRSNRTCDAVNADQYWSCKPGEILVHDIRAERMSMQTKAGWCFYWQVVYTFYFKRGGWITSLMDTGLRQLVDKPIYYSLTDKRISHWVPDGDVAPVLDKNGLPVTAPVRLDGKGHKLANPNDKSVFLDFEVHVKTFFSWMNLPFLRVKL